MKHLLILTLISLLSAVVPTDAAAQKAREILDKAANRLEQSNGAKAGFVLTNFTGTVENARTEGKIEMRGRAFHLTTQEMQIWFDGRTQWSMFSGTDEVNVEEPTDEEMARMNPYAFIALYKNGYKYKLKRNVTLNDQLTYEIRLTAEKRASQLATIILNLDMKTLDPLCIRMKHEGDWVRISIRGLQLNQQYTADTFTFPTAKYPKAQLIDLR